MGGYGVEMRKLLVGLAIGLAALPASGQSVRAGIDAWQKGDTAGAVAIWRPLRKKARRKPRAGRVHELPARQTGTPGLIRTVPYRPPPPALPVAEPDPVVSIPRSTCMAGEPAGAP